MTRPDTDEKVITGVKIKKLFRKETTRQAYGVRASYGSFFEAELGSDKWFEAVPFANRDQVLAQAVALDLEYVLLPSLYLGVAYTLCWSV